MAKRRYKVTKQTRRTYDAMRAIRAHGDVQTLRREGAAGMYANAYDLGYRDIEPLWIHPESAAAAAWRAGRDDALDDQKG